MKFRRGIVAIVSMSVIGPAWADGACQSKAVSVALRLVPASEADLFGQFLSVDARGRVCPTQAGTATEVLGDAGIISAVDRRRVDLPVGKADLPRVGLWFDAERVESFLSGSNVAESASDLLLTLAPGSPAISLPILEQRMFSRAGRDIIAFRTLLPLSGTALTAWRSAVAARDATRPPTVLMDVSGSVQGYLDRLLTDLARPLLRSEAGLADIVVLTTTDGQTFSPPRETTLADLAQESGDLPGAAARGFDAAALLADRPVVVLYGGDLALPPRITRADPARLHVVQLTPELDAELHESAANLGVSARLRGFAPRNGSALATALLAEPDFKSARTQEDDIAAALSTGQIAAGFPAFLPQTTVAEARLQAAQADGFVWQAIPVWMIRNDLLMTVQADAP